MNDFEIKVIEERIKKIERRGKKGSLWLVRKLKRKLR